MSPPGRQQPINRFRRLLKNAPACAEASAGRQMQVEPCEIPFSGAPEILRRERFKTVPYRSTPQQACPVLDTGKDEPACR